MHARVTAIDVIPGRLDELVQVFDTLILPLAREQKGFRQAVLLRDPDSNKALLITTWATREDMIDSESSLYFREKLAALSSASSGRVSTSYYQNGEE